MSRRSSSPQEDAIDRRGLERKFLRAAEQRFASAEFLLANRMSRDAVYLAGYVVECAIKALFVHTTSERDLRAVVTRISRGAAGHDLEGLKAVLKKTCAMPVEISRHFSHVRMWSTEWRYESGLLAYNEAMAFLKAAKAILEWVKRSW